MKGKFATPSKRLKYCKLGCLKNFLLLFMSLLTSLIVKYSHILARIYFVFLIKRPVLNLKSFEYTNLDLSEKIQGIVIKKDKF